MNKLRLLKESLTYRICFSEIDMRQALASSNLLAYNRPLIFFEFIELVPLSHVPKTRVSADAIPGPEFIAGLMQSFINFGFPHSMAARIWCSVRGCLVVN